MTLLNDLNIVRAVIYPDGTYFNNGITTIDKKSKSTVPNDKQRLTKRYKLTNHYKQDDLCLVIVADKKDLAIEFDSVYHSKFKKAIVESSIDIKLAIHDELRSAKSTKSLSCRLNTIFRLYDKRFIKKGDKVDRVFHSLSNISKISRKHLSVKGLKYNNLDIVNCQPLLLCYFLKKHKHKIDINYLDDCQSGNLYERFISEGKSYVDYEYIIKDGEIVGKTKHTIDIGYNLSDNEFEDIRATIKVLLYKSIFFDFKPNTDIAQAFKILYPNIFETMLGFENTDVKMASRLQNIEAEIFNNLVPKKSKFYFTLFDAIYFTSEEDAGLLISTILSKFQKYNLTPKLKYNEQTNIN
jgi:hypothetical protein